MTTDLEDGMGLLSRVQVTAAGGSAEIRHCKTSFSPSTAWASCSFSVKEGAVPLLAGGLLAGTLFSAFFPIIPPSTTVHPCSQFLSFFSSFFRTGLATGTWELGVAFWASEGARAFGAGVLALPFSVGGFFFEPSTDLKSVTAGLGGGTFSGSGVFGVPFLPSTERKSTCWGAWTFLSSSDTVLGLTCRCRFARKSICSAGISFSSSSEKLLVLTFLPKMSRKSSCSASCCLKLSSVCSRVSTRLFSTPRTSSCSSSAALVSLLFFLKPLDLPKVSLPWSPLSLRSPELADTLPLWSEKEKKERARKGAGLKMSGNNLRAGTKYVYRRGGWLEEHTPLVYCISDDFRSHIRAQTKKISSTLAWYNVLSLYDENNLLGHIWGLGWTAASLGL